MGKVGSSSWKEPFQIFPDLLLFLAYVETDLPKLYLQLCFSFDKLLFKNRRTTEGYFTRLGTHTDILSKSLESH